MASPMRKGLAFPRRGLVTAFSLLAWVPAVVFLSDNTYEVAHLRGVSMNPSFNTPLPVEGSVGGSSSNPISRDLVLVSKFSPTSNLRRGDVVSFWTPHDPEKMAVKRIIALEEDEVQTRPPYPFRKEMVPVGHVWVEGDNPEGRFSRDSNSYGPVAKGLITGKIVARIWPNPTWIKSEEWEQSEDRSRDTRVRRNVGNLVKPQVYR